MSNINNIGVTPLSESLIKKFKEDPDWINLFKETEQFDKIIPKQISKSLIKKFKEDPDWIKLLPQNNNQ